MGRRCVIEPDLSSSPPAPPNLGLAQGTLEKSKFGGEGGGFFSRTENLIFMARGQLLCMRFAGARPHADKSHVPHQPPRAGSRRPSCRWLCSGKAHPPQPPPARRREEPELCANRAGVHLLRGEVSRKHQAATHTFRKSLTTFSTEEHLWVCCTAWGCVCVFLKGERMLQVIKIWKKTIRPRIDRDFLPSQKVVTLKH